MQNEPFLVTDGNVGQITAEDKADDGFLKLKTHPQDPEQKFINFSLAVRTSPDDVKPPRISWYECSVWNKYAEAMRKYILQGRLIEVRGKPEIRKWEVQQGENAGQLRTTVTLLVTKISLGALAGSSAKPSDDVITDGVVPPAASNAANDQEVPPQS